MARSLCFSAVIVWTLAACGSSGTTGAASGSTTGAGSSGASSSGTASSSATSAGSSSAAGSSTAGAGSSGSSAGKTTGTGSTSASTGGGSTSSGASSGASTAIIRVHYPVGSAALTVCGSGGGLNWTTGQSLSASSGDTYTFTLTGVTGTLEWKPLINGTWALGPNYHVSAGQTVDEWPHFTTTTGQVETLITAFQSTVLGDSRAIYAYLPASYAENTDATYPVVYMHDGQNLWAALPQLAFGGTWNVDTTFDTASQQGACSANGLAGWGAQPLGGTPATCNADADCPSNDCETFPEAIVIGIANDANRIYEYTPTTDPTQTSLGAAGGADQYLQMVVTELKPTIDGMLRTRPGPASTAMAGSSLGGLVTAYAGVKYPNVFGLVAAISPSTWWDNNVIVTDVQGTGSARPAIVYVDSGQGSVDDEANTDLLAAAYLALGYVDGTNFRHVIQPGAQHAEAYWAQRFPGAMQLLLGER